MHVCTSAVYWFLWWNFYTLFYCCWGHRREFLICGHWRAPGWMRRHWSSLSFTGHQLCKVWGTYSTLGWCMCCSFPALPLKPRPSPERQCVLTGPATTMTASPRHGGAACEPALTCCQKERSAVCASPSLLCQTSGPADDQAEFVWSLQQQFQALLWYLELLLKLVGTIFFFFFRAKVAFSVPLAWSHPCQRLNSSVSKREKKSFVVS